MKYVACCSGGKDSCAQVVVGRKYDEPIDEIVYSEVMFDKDTSGELPEHREFMYNVAIPKFEKMGYKVTVLRAEETYVDRFFRVKQKGERKGQIYGFPPTGMCWVNSDIKMKPIREFWSNYPEEFTQYVGIAKDEEERLDRIVNTANKISLLKKYDVVEADTYAICRKENLLSPVYDFSKRNGCWFCPNQSYAQLEHLRKVHPQLWKRLMELQEVSPHPFRVKCPMQKLENRFFWEDQQYDMFNTNYDYNIL